MTKDNAPDVARRRFIFSMAATFGLGAASGVGGALFWASRSKTFDEYLRAKKDTALAGLADRVAPQDGYVTTVSFGGSITRLISAGAISPKKFQWLYSRRGGLPEWVGQLFTGPSAEPIKLSFKTAPYLLNLLWPLGIANKTDFNKKSRLNGKDLPRFASTGGWQLGEADNGSAYFNRVEAIRLDGAQEETVLNVARNVYRPCCNNSTFFQDCNHGSAVLGLLELAASQGAVDEDLFRLALIASAFWYPSQYVETALYFEEVEGKTWGEVAPKTILGKRFSSASGWNRNVHAALIKANLLPSSGPQGQGGCSI